MESRGHAQAKLFKNEDVETLRSCRVYTIDKITVSGKLSSSLPKKTDEIAIVLTLQKKGRN